MLRIAHFFTALVLAVTLLPTNGMAAEPVSVREVTTRWSGVENISGTVVTKEYMGDSDVPSSVMNGQFTFINPALVAITYTQYNTDMTIVGDEIYNGNRNMILIRDNGATPPTTDPHPERSLGHFFSRTPNVGGLVTGSNATRDLTLLQFGRRGSAAMIQIQFWNHPASRRGLPRKMMVHREGVRVETEFRY